jgi:hypothetical protein
MQDEDKCQYDSDSMSICSDENIPLRAQIVRKSRKSHTNIVLTILILTNLTLCALYTNLRIRFANLQSNLSGLQPELFPCKQYTIRIQSSQFKSPSLSKLKVHGISQEKSYIFAHSRRNTVRWRSKSGA